MNMGASNQELVELRDRLRRLEQRALAAEAFIAQNPPFQLWRRVKYAYLNRQGIWHPHSIPPHFVYHPLFLSHEQCGGVTDGQ